MRLITRGVWQYAALLIFLFVIVSVAVWTTMSYLYDNIGAPEYQKVLYVTNFKLLALTMGFMLIAGAYGIWAIQSSAESESRFRVSEIVAGMDYLDDGLLVVDKRGRVTGANPALKKSAPNDVIADELLGDVFPCLSEDDVRLLLDLHGPNELQRDIFDSNQRRTLRFRSQTAGGLCMILVSDVTTVRTRELHEQQVARFELVGRIVRGAAHDFNNVLSSISGYASLIPRLQPNSSEMKDSIDSISREAGKGALLAGHLLEFSRLGVAGKPTENLGEHVKKAGDLIRVGLPPEWNVEVTIDEDYPVVPFSGLQIEQMVLNLGLVAADSLSRPGVVRVTAGRPHTGDHLLNVGDKFAAAVLVSADRPESGRVTDLDMDDIGNRTAAEEAGAIQSVVRSVLEEAGGALDVFSGTDGASIYRIVLPIGVVETDDQEAEKLPDELRSYVADWNVLMASSASSSDKIERQLLETVAKVERVDNIVSALACVENGQDLQAIVIEKELLGDEANGLLRAVTKLCPNTGIVVLCEDPESSSRNLPQNVVCESRRAGLSQTVRAIVDAKGQSVRR